MGGLPEAMLYNLEAQRCAKLAAYARFPDLLRMKTAMSLQLAHASLMTVSPFTLFRLLHR